MQGLTHRRRSQSASTASAPARRRSTESSWRGATKRAHPHHPFTSPSPDSVSPYKWNVEDWRSKRRRRDHSPSSDSMDESTSSRRKRTTTSPLTSAFPATSADFHLFPTRPTARSRRRSRRSPSPIDRDGDSHLSNLRSAAFWELRRSVADNGEGFVSCMRDYERSRSRVDSDSPRARRGRRQSSLTTPVRSCPSNMDVWDANDDDEDDIQIFSGDIPAFTFHSKTSSNTSLSGSTNYTSGTLATSSGKCSSPIASSASSCISDDDSITAQKTVFQNIVPASSSSPLQSTSGLPSTRSEKALAALTLAMANGAGSIHDYDALQFAATVVGHDDGTVGEMWR